MPQAQVAPAGSFGEGIAKGLGAAANAGMDIVNMMAQKEAFKENEALKVKNEQEAALSKQKQQLDTNRAINHFLSFNAAMFDHEQKIIADPNVDPSDYPKQVEEFSSKYMQDVESKVPPDVWLQVQPKFREKAIQSQQRAYDLAQNEIEDQSWAEDLGMVDNIVNDPTKTAAEKITLLKAPDLFAGSGRKEHEIEAERQKRIAYVADTAVKGLFNGAGSDTQKLRAVKELLTRTNDDGSFAYLPDMPQNDREDYRSTLQQKIKQAEHLQEMERNQRATAARQAAQELVTEYREKVNSGWMPNTKEDYAFVRQVKQYAAYSPSLARQYNDATVKMTSFASREKFRAADPLGTAAAEKGVILPPIDVTAPMGPQLAKRSEAAKRLGVTSLFKGDEIDALTNSLSKKDAVEQLKTIKTLTAQLGTWSRQTFSAAAEQTKTKDPGLSALFKLASDGDMHSVRLYASGRQFLASDKKDFLHQKVTAIKTELNDQLETTMGTALAALPQSRNALKDAVAVAYIGAATSQGDTLDKVNPTLLADVRRRIIGETVPTGNTSIFTGGSWKTTIIPRGMTTDQFLNNIKAITPVSINLSGGVEGMDDEEAAKFIKKTAWHEFGDGYGFYRDGKLLMGKNGKPFIWRQ